MLEGSGGLSEVWVVHVCPFHGRSPGKSHLSYFIAIDGQFRVYDELLLVVVEESLLGREETCMGGSGHFFIRRHLPFSHVVLAHVIKLELLH